MNHAPCRTQLHSHRRHRAPMVAILAANLRVEEIALLASSVGKKATGPGTAPHRRQILTLM